jgi:cell division protein FtsB
MPANASERLAAAARLRHEQTLARPRTALRQFEASGESVTYTRVAATAKVSRAWLYSQPEIRAAVERLRAINGRSTAATVPARQRTSEASLVRRLEAAHRRNQELTQQVTDLRIQLAAAHGALRDSKTGR